LFQLHQIRAFEEQADKNYMAEKIHGNIIWKFVPIMGLRFDLFDFRIMKDKLVHA
jgi:hypothetical protein